MKMIAGSALLSLAFFLSLSLTLPLVFLLSFLICSPPVYPTPSCFLLCAGDQRDSTRGRVTKKSAYRLVNLNTHTQTRVSTRKQTQEQ